MKGVEMKLANKLLIPLAMLLIFSLGCAHLPKKEITGVTKQASSIRFTGYTTTVEIKGSPEEV